MSSWTESDNRLHKTYVFADFADAMAFMLRASYEAERLNHHPEWKNIYNKVFVELTTHDTGTVTDRDRQLAEALDRLYHRSDPL